MLSIERREALKQLMLGEKTVTVAAAAQRFGVSTETIRRDFEALNAEGFLIKTYGGASLACRNYDATPQSIKSRLFVKNKQRMASRAAREVKPGDCIFLDHSTTVAAMCAEIKNLPITVMTNSLLVIEQLADIPTIKLVVTGGYLDCPSQGLLGLEAVRFIQKHSVDRAFLSCQAVDTLKGLCDGSEAMADLRLHIVENANAAYLLADHTKFGRTAFTHICGFSRIHTVITDMVMDPTWRTLLYENQVHLIECPEEGADPLNAPSVAAFSGHGKK